MCQVQIHADCGYSEECSIQGITVVSDKRLNVVKVPDCRDVYLETTTDASWTYILLDDEDGNEKCKVNPDGATVNFFDNDPNGNPIDWKYASYESIRQELIRVINSGAFVEKIWYEHRAPQKQQYIYTLDHTKVFE